MILRGPTDWQDDVDYEVSASGTCPNKSILDGISRYRCGCLAGPCEEALALKRAAIDLYYRDVINKGCEGIRDHVRPSDIYPQGGIFLPEAFGKSGQEMCAALLLHYFRALGIWAPFRPNEYGGWLGKRLRDKAVKEVDYILSNPIFARPAVDGLWALMDRGFIVPLVPLREGEEVRDRLVHVTEEFILRCYFSAAGLKREAVAALLGKLPPIHQPSSVRNP